ncbi:MAG: GspE/PulE family protein [Oligoflexales bacterium]
MKFAEFVHSKHHCTKEQLRTILKIYQYRKEKVGRLMVELGYINQQTLDSLLIQFIKPECNKSFKELETEKSKVPLTLQEQLNPFNVIAIDLTTRRLTLVADHFSDVTIQSVEAFFELEVTLLRVKGSVFRLLQGENHDDKKQKSNIVLAGDLTCDQRISEENPYTQLIHQCFIAACKLKASDIHFEPFADKFLIRFRTHGALQDWKVIEAEHTEPITNKLKWILNLDLAIISKPQDARACFKSMAIDVRANSMPTAGGSEKIVLRIQYQEQKLSLQDIGLSKDKIEMLKCNILKREGLIIISGPTGSGKTTTLYALLEEMDRLGKNISTLENPVEKSLERITQSNVETKEDFNDFQKALMRQDPDIILLGEIRDEETADLSMKLASTGHLVLSTVHANGAREVVDRLLNLGVDEFTIKTNLRLSVAQRLVRRICPKCRIKLENGLFRANPDGCVQCTGGITGRIAIIEYLEKSDLGDKRMPTTLKDECIALAQKGVIDESEIEAIT